MTKRTIFIGDIHGCYDEFQLLLEKLKITDEDIIYLVGDMINKGPKSWKVIKFIYKNRNQFKCVLGNHELSFLGYLNGINQEYENEIYLKLKSKLEKHPKVLNFIKTIPLFIEEEKFITLHGGLDFSKKIEDHLPSEITNIRLVNERPWYEQYKGKKKIIYGHWAMNGLTITNNTVGLDTGCPYGGALTAYILETNEIYSQPALDIYKNIYTKYNNYALRKTKEIK